MKITNIGGATAIVEHAGIRILFDPWLDEGIFHGAWYHFPPLAINLSEIGHLDYIYISHIHEDHCSAATLKHLNKDAEIIIMDKKPNFVAKFLDNHQFHFKKVHLVKPNTPLPLLPNLTVDMLEGDPANPMSHAIDSTLIMQWDNFVLVNANDCIPYQTGMDYILTTYGKVDLALLPYGGGSGYPSCYLNLTHEQKLAERDRIIATRANNFISHVNYLKPAYVLPFADQYVVAGSRSHLNQYISHSVSPGDVTAYIEDKEFASQLLLLNSGQSYDFQLAQKVPKTDYYRYTHQDREKFLSQLSEVKYDFEHFALNPNLALDRLVAYARARMWQMQRIKQYFPAMTLYLAANDCKRCFKIEWAKEQAEEVRYDQHLQPPFLRISMPGTLLMLLLVGQISWNIADAALFLDYERDPNVYDGKIYEFLNYLRA